jgi:hypothetical protein
MPKSKSIPMMWEIVKDLKPESIEKLHAAFQEMQEALAIKDNNPGVGSKRGKEEAKGGPIDPKSDKEEEMEEIDSDAVKARKMDSFDRHNMRGKAFDDEGARISYRAPHVQMDYM